MIRILLAAPQPDLRKALRLLILDLGMQVVGEAADWDTTLALAPETKPNMVVLDWDLTPLGSGNTLAQLRAVCPAAVVIVLISHLDARHQAALSAGADVFISKGEAPSRVADRLREAAANYQRHGQPLEPLAP
ncbi:MAG: response regulator transcription factor [Chloroflexi bacterium]|nr:response regulator transcription factor [Chloroflexota bacterium]